MDMRQLTCGKRVTTGAVGVDELEPCSRFESDASRSVIGRSYQVRPLFADHDRGGVCIRAWHTRHDRSINDAQANGSEHLQVRTYNGTDGIGAARVVHADARGTCRGSAGSPRWAGLAVLECREG